MRSFYIKFSLDPKFLQRLRLLLNFKALFAGLDIGNLENIF